MEKTLKETLTDEFATYLPRRDLDYLGWQDAATDLSLDTWIEVSVVRGGSEGFYIHFREIEAGAPGGRLFALGKAWTLDAVIKCADHFTRLIQGENFWRYRNV